MSQIAPTQKESFSDTPRDQQRQSISHEKSQNPGY